MSNDMSLIRLEEECSICIEKLLDGTDNPIAKVIPCHHCYHDMCIKSWSLRANSCPTCRGQFNKVEVVDKFGNTILDYKVEDKIFPMDPNYLAPSIHDEYNADEQEQQLIAEQRQQIESYSVPFGVRCALCSVTANGGLSICNNCSSSFHNYCIDSSSIEPGYWQCPLCENVQESISFAPSTTRRRTRAMSRAARGTRNAISAGNANSSAIRTRRNQYTQRTDNTYLRLSRNFRNNNDEHISTMLTQSSNLVGSHHLRGDNVFERAEEQNAWDEFENLRKNDVSTSERRMPRTTTKNVPLSAATSSSSGSSVMAAENNVSKLKRPSRRGKFPNRDVIQRIANGSTTGKPVLDEKNQSNRPLVPKNTYKSTVMSLISEMHSNNKSEDVGSFSRTSYQSNNGYANSDASSSKDLESTFSQFTPPISPSSSSSSPDGYLSPSSTLNPNVFSAKGKEKL